MSVWSDLGGALPAGLGAAVVMLVQQAAKWLRVQSIAAKVRREARAEGIEGPAFGSSGWLWEQIQRERSQRHAYQRIVNNLAERIAKLEGRHESGEQERIAADHDTDPVPAPPMVDEIRPRAASRSDIRTGRRSRP